MKSYKLTKVFQQKISFIRFYGKAAYFIFISTKIINVIGTFKYFVKYF